MLDYVNLDFTRCFAKVEIVDIFPCFLIFFYLFILFLCVEKG